MKYFLILLTIGFLACNKDDKDNSSQCTKLQTEYCTLQAQLDTASTASAPALVQAINFKTEEMRRAGCTTKPCK